MPRIKGRNTQATREAVLAAAEWAFAEYGFENATFAIIAQRAGVTAATLPYHFADKKGLWDATIESFYKGLFAFATTVRPNEPLEAVLGSFYDWAMHHRSGIRVIIRHVIETGSLDREVREVGMMRAFDLVAAQASQRYGVDRDAALDTTIAVTHLMTRFITNSPEDNRRAFHVDNDAEVRARVVSILSRVAHCLLGIGPMSSALAGASAPRETLV